MKLVPVGRLAQAHHEHHFLHSILAFHDNKCDEGPLKLQECNRDANLAKQTVIALMVEYVGHRYVVDRYLLEIRV